MIRRMKYQILITFLVLAGFAGIASADPCPSLNAVKPSDSYGDVTTSISGKTVTYHVTASVDIQGLCIYETNLANLGPLTGTSPISWSFSHPGSQNFFEFKRTASSQLLQPGDSKDVGSVDFINNPLPTSDEIYALHINDPVCGTAITCFVFPGPSQPVPEVSTIVLSSAGLLGLVLISRKYKKRN